jgi:hypothetical protein
MALTANYVGNYIRKEGEHKGKTFHIYTISGTTAELKLYADTKQFKAYPRKSATGELQMHTMYMDALRDVLPMYKKQNGDYTLDQSETRKEMSRLEILQGSSPAMATQFASRLADKVFGAGKTTSTVANAFIQEPVTSGDDAELNADM